METKVLSVRVPATFAKELRSHCKHNNLSVSEYMQKGFTNVGMAQFGEIEIQTETADMLLSVAGGSATGIIAYKGIKSVFLNKGFTEQNAEIYSMICGIAVGLLASVGLKELLKMMKD